MALHVSEIECTQPSYTVGSKVLCGDRFLTNRTFPENIEFLECKTLRRLGESRAGCT